MKQFVEDTIKCLERDYINSNARLISDYNREKELMKSYRGREILELLQNADDELCEGYPKEVKISFVNNKLIVSNYGNPFSKDGVSSLFYPNNSGKSDRKRKVIGNKGTGFRSILGWAKEIEIHSGDFHVLYSEEISQNHLKELFGSDNYNSKKHKAPVLAFPKVILANNQEYTTQVSINVIDDIEITSDILKQLNSINDELLLFLNNTEILIIETTDSFVKYVRKSNGNEVIVEKFVNDNLQACETWIFNRKDGELNDEIFSVVIAYKKSGEDPKNRVIYSYFPTEIAFPYPVLVHSNFVLDSNRNHLVKKDKSNNYILENVAQLLTEITINRFSDRVSYDALEFLLLHDSFSTDLQNYDFEEKLFQSIAKTKIFPNVNGTYISLANKPVFFENGLSKYLSGREFTDLLQNYEESDYFKQERFISELKMIPENHHFWEYNYDYLVNSIDNWITKQVKSLTKASISKIAYTALRFIDEFENDSQFKDKRPCFIINADGKIIPLNSNIFSVSDNIELSKFPAFSHVEFIHPKLMKAFAELDDYYMSRLSYYKVAVGSCHTFVEGMYLYISDMIASGKKKQAKNSCITALRWMWKNKDALKSEDEIYPFYWITKGGDLCKTTELYYGKEYGNDLGERLFSSVANQKLAANIEEYFGAVDFETKCDFIKMLGVVDLPRVIEEKVTVNDKTKQERILQGLKYPYRLEGRESFKNIQDAKRQINYFTCYSTAADCVELILDNANTIDILDWILSDNKLHEILRNHSENHNGQVYITWGLKSTPRELVDIKRPYALLSYEFETRKWIQVNGERYSINECILTQTLNNTLSPILVEPDIGYFIKDKDKKIKRSVLESIYKNLLIELSVKSNFSELPINKIYEVLNALPEIDNSKKIAKSLYMELIKDTDNNYEKADLEKTSEYKRFIKSGKVLCNTGYQLCNDSKYLDGRDICEKIAQKFNLIELPQRMSRPRIELLLGVKRLELQGSIVGEPVIHDVNRKFQEDFKNYKPLAFCYRIDAKKALEGEARKFSNLSVVLCSNITANYNGNEVQIEDYEYILHGSNTYYLKVADSLTDKNFRYNYELASAIGSIIAAYMDIPDLMYSCRSLYSLSQKNREKQVENDLGDSTIISRSRRALNFNKTTKDEFIEILNEISPVDFAEYRDCLERINFDNLTSVSNSPVIIDCFIKAQTDISNYNNQNPSIPIDLTEYFSDRIESHLPLYKEKYKISRYEEYRDKDFDEKKQLVSLFAGYESLTILIENSVYFNPEKEIVKQLQINELLDTMDLNQIYLSNKEEWKSQHPCNDCIEEFLNDTGNQSLLYYACYDELNRIFETFLKEISSEEETIEYPSIEVNKLCHPLIQPKQIKTVSRARPETRTGFTPISGKKKESIGRIGEKIVFDYLSKDDSLKHLEWVSENAKKEQINPEGRAGLGYDFDIVLSDEIRQYIEVKSSESSLEKGIVFYMSDLEYQFACEHEKDYIIFYVSGVLSPHPEISVLSDIIVDGSFNDEKFYVNSKSEYAISADIVNANKSKK